MARTPDLRAAIESDEPAIVACVCAAYEPFIAAIGRDPAPMLDDYTDLIGQGVVTVAEEGGAVVGVIVMWSNEGHFYVDNIAVAPSRHGIGLGTMLLQEADQAARAAGHSEVRLYTNEVMASNISYYPRRGFVETHRAMQNGYRRVFYSKRLDP